MNGHHLELPSHETPDGALGVHEAYYDDGGIPTSWTQRPTVAGDSIEEIGGELDQVMKALDEPILEYGESEHCL